MFPELFLQSSGTGPPLRIGILLDGFEQYRAFQQVIEHIQRSNFASIELLVLNESADAAPPTPQPKWKTLAAILKDSKRRSRLAYNLYEKFDARYFPQDDDPLESIDCTEQLAQVDVLRVTPLTKGFVQRILPENIAKIRSYDLDVILRFGFNILKGDILTAAKYGIWSYHHGDNDFYRGGPPYFWELVEGSQLSGAILQVLTEELDGGKVLAKGQFATSPGLSVRRNRYSPYWGSAAFVIQKLHELHSYGWDHVVHRAAADAPYKGKRKLYRTPTNREVCGWFLKGAAGIAWNRIRRTFSGSQDWEWQIALRTQAEPSLLESEVEARKSFRWQIAPKGHFEADPFLVSRDNKTWMFFEDYVYVKKKGILCCRDVRDDGTLGAAVTVLDCSYHLSYPFVFWCGDEMFMIPESWANKTIDLFRATDFPYHWELEKTLFHGQCVDTTLLIDSGIFWFFTTFFAPFGSGQCLCLFFADSLTGEWQSHPCNPISLDIRNARCGGRFLRQRGKLYRVSQNGAGQYGAALVFNEVVTLTKTDYQEVQTKTIEPWPPHSGTHTYDRYRDLEVIDGVMQRKASDLHVPAEFPPLGKQLQQSVGR